MRVFTFFLAFNLVISAFASNDLMLSRSKIHETHLIPWSGEPAKDYSVDAFFSAYHDTYLLNKPITWVQIKDDLDKIGMRHIRYQQFYQGVKVEHGTMILHLRNDKVVSFNGEIYTHFSATVAPDIGQTTEAYILIHKDIKMVRLPETVYMVYADGMAYLCETYLAGSEQESTLDKLFIAKNKNQIIRIEPQHVDVDVKGKAKTHYIGEQVIITDSLAPNKFRMREKARLIRTFHNSQMGRDFFDTDNYWNNKDSNIAGDVQYSMQLLWTFLEDKFGWDGYANHHDSMSGLLGLLGTGNAFWSMWGNYASFMAGSNDSVGPCASIDIVGHEFGHGIADENALLVYFNESCMLHESFADISGTLLEWYHDSSSFNWILGDRVWKGGIRSMSNPNAFGHADTYKGKYFSKSGCHDNGGVQNYWFYMLVKGDTGTNDFGYEYNVSGIGFEKAMAIIYRAVLYYWTANTTFNESTTHSLQAAKDLYGSCSKELITALAAWKAVGLEDTSFTKIDLVTDIVGSKLVCTTLPYTLKLQSQGDAGRKVTWYLPDGDSTHTRSINYAVKKTGQNIFYLKSEVCGHTLWDTAITYITHQPAAKFKLDKLTACDNGRDTVKTINQTDETDSTLALKYEWNVWPYNNIVKAKNISHHVKDHYSITFVLSASYENGCGDTVRQTVSLIDKPLVSFNPITSCEGDNYKFINTSDTVGKTMLFNWYQDSVHLTNNFNPNVLATASGLHTILLSGMDVATGCYADSSLDVTIYQKPKPTFDVVNPCAYQMMQLINTTKDTTPLNYFRWYLPDAKPFNRDTFSFKNDGNLIIPVALEYKYKNGCLGTAYDTINLEYLKAGFASVDSICSNSNVELRSSATPNMIDTKWFIDEVFVGTDSIMIHKNIQAGVHHIVQEISSTKCTDKLSKTIVALELPEVNFGLNKDICDGDYAIVTNASTNAGKTTYTWLWGDGKTNGGDTTSHRYHLQNKAETESFVISLKATNEHGCVGESAKSITVNAPPNPDFTYTVQYLTVTFNQVDQKSSSTYDWLFGDGAVSHKINPTHTYAEHGKYDVTLHVISADGCSALQTKYDVLGKLSVDNVSKNEIRIVPNPGFSRFQLSGLTNNSQQKLMLYDMSGRLLWHQEISPILGSFVLNVNLPVGVYNLSIIGEDGIKTSRIIVSTP